MNPNNLPAPVVCFFFYAHRVIPACFICHLNVFVRLELHGGLLDKFDVFVGHLSVKFSVHKPSNKTKGFHKKLITPTPRPPV